MRVGNAMAYVRGLRSWRQRIAFAFARIAARLRVPTPHFIEAAISGQFLTPEGNLLDLRPGLDYLIAHPGHERETHAWIAQQVAGQAGVMLDVGGYIGTFALKHRSRFDLVFVFEPFPANYLACVRNVQLSNARHQVIVVQAAVSDRAGRTELCLHTDDTHSLIGAGGHTTTVHAITLDGFLQDRHVPFEAVRLLKADIEGAELLMLRGADKLLRRGRPLIVVEALSVEADAQITEHLTALDYARVQRLDGKNVAFRSTASPAV
jgi:FkbM family methyltransferase